MGSTGKVRIRLDEWGLWCSVGGYMARPVGDTQFAEGDAVHVWHFDGSIRAGVGKSPSMRRGQYLEYWVLSADDHWNPADSFELAHAITTRQEFIDHKRDLFRVQFPELVKQ